MIPQYKPDPENPLYSKILSKRESKQIVQSMEIRERVNREIQQAQRFQQRQYEKNMPSFIAKLEDKWK